MRRIAALTAIACALAIAACGGDEGSGATSTQGPNLSAAPSGGIDIRGKITDLATPNPGVSIGAMEVEGEVESDTKYHRRALVRIYDYTVIQRKQGAEIFPASAVDLEIGKRVEIKFTGIVAELNPIQAPAGEITILE